MAPLVETADLFTLEVASFTGKESNGEDITTFVALYGKYVGKLSIPGVDHPLVVTVELLE